MRENNFKRIDIRKQCLIEDDQLTINNNRDS